MLNETEAAASFHGLCHFFGRLSKASRAGMKAASVSFNILSLLIAKCLTAVNY